MKLIVYGMIVSIMLRGLIACREELIIDDPGNLVPKTVDEDPTLPAITVNGTQLHAEAYGNPSGPIIVFLHGGPGADYRNALQVRQLAGDGYRVIFYDQRGAGLSKRHNRGLYSIDIMLEDLASVINYYRVAPAQKVFLFGHSWGAILAAAYINKYPDRVDGSVFAEPGGFTFDQLMEYIESSRKFKIFDESANDALYLDQFITGKKVNDHIRLDYKLGILSASSYTKDNPQGIEGVSPFWRQGAVSFNALFEFGKKDGFDVTANLGDFKKSVLFLKAELNNANPQTRAQQLASYFPNSQLKIINGTGHELIYFKWDSVYPIVLNYFNSLK